jgi:hypothetical protein
MTPQSPQTDPKTPKTPAPAPAPSKKRLELNSKNLSLLLIAGLAVTAVLFVAVMIMGLSVLGGKSKSLVDLKAQSQSLDSELLNLAQAKKDVQKYAYFKQVAKTVIPNDRSSCRHQDSKHNLPNQQPGPNHRHSRHHQHGRRDG